MPDPPGDLPGLVFDAFVFLICVWVVVDARRALRLLSFNVRTEFAPWKLIFFRLAFGSIALGLGIKLLPALWHGL